MLELVDVHTEPTAPDTLYKLLTERMPTQAISHKVMPTWQEHCAFVDSRPYQFWYLIKDGENFVGAIYLTQRLSEIGLHLFLAHDKQETRWAAFQMLAGKHPRARYIANINPENATLIEFFGKIGFRHIQNTYELMT